MTGPEAAPPAGWLIDPSDASLLRWWDGSTWSDFRRQREGSVPDAPTQAPPPAPAPTAAPPTTAVAWSPTGATTDSGAAATTAAPVAWPGARRSPVLTKAVPANPPARPAVQPTAKPTPQPTAKPTPQPTTKPTPQPTTKPTPQPTAKPVATPQPFTRQWTTTVAAIDAVRPDGRSAALLAAVGPEVLASAESDEEVFAGFTVTLHDEHRRPDRLGAASGDLDLILTDRRVLLVGRDLGDPPWVALALDDVVAVVGLRDHGLRVDFDDEVSLFLHQDRSTRRGDDLGAMLRTVTEVDLPQHSGSPGNPPAATDWADLGLEFSPRPGRRSVGAEVVGVADESHGAALGIAPGDHVAAIDGVVVRTATDVVDLLATYRVGEEITVEWSSGRRTWRGTVVL